MFVLLESIDEWYVSMSESDIFFFHCIGYEIGYNDMQIAFLRSF